MGDFEITRDEIAAAAVRITGRVRRTPVVELEQLPGLPRLTLKLDLLRRPSRLGLRRERMADAGVAGLAPLSNV